MGAKASTYAISLVGASQSGKTALIAGLAKSNDRKFTVGFANNASRACLERSISLIDSATWPEPTTPDDLRDLSLVLNFGARRSAKISLTDYAGVRIQDPTYTERIVGTPSGALVLLNPGMDILHDAVRRNEMTCALKGAVDHLAKSGCIAAAFVVTACDRLKTDLAGFADEFEGYAAEIANYLETSGMEWKRFDVSITGELEKQSAPSIAQGTANTSRAPFIWITETISRRARKENLLRLARLTIILGVSISAFALCGKLYREWTAEREAEKAESEIRLLFSEADEAERRRSEAGLKEATDKIAAFISEKFPQHGGPDLPLSRFSDMEAAWRGEYDKYLAAYLDAVLDNMDSNPGDRASPADCAEFEKTLSAFSPADINLKHRLLSRWNSEKSALGEKYVKAVADKTGREISALSEKKIDRVRQEDIDRIINDIRLLRDSAAVPEITAKEWLAALAAREADLLQFKLVRLCQESNFQDIRNTLEKTEALSRKYAEAGDETLSGLRGRLNAAIDLFLSRFTENFLNWKEGSRTRPAFTTDDYAYAIKQSLDVADSRRPGKKLYEAFLERLENDFAEAEKSWLATMETDCKSFLESVQSEGAPPPALFRKYREWYSEFAAESNPYRGDMVDPVVDRLLLEGMATWIRAWTETLYGKERIWNSDVKPEARDEAMKKTEEEFKEFKTLCYSLANSRGRGGLTDKAKSVRLAKLATDPLKGNIGAGNDQCFAKKIQISKIYITVGMTSKSKSFNKLTFGAEISSRTWDFGESEKEDRVREEKRTIAAPDSVTVTAEDDGKEMLLFDGAHEIEVNPWGDIVISLPVKESAGTWWNWRINGEASPSWNFPGERFPGLLDAQEISFNHIDGAFKAGISMKIEYEVSGYGLLDLLKDAEK